MRVSYRNTIVDEYVLDFEGYSVPLSMIVHQMNLTQFVKVLDNLPDDEQMWRHIEMYGYGTPSETTRLLVAIGCITTQAKQHGWTQRYFDSRLRSLIVFNTSFPDRVCLQEIINQAVVLVQI